MWILERIQANNLCAFKELDYTLNQQHTTLIFGNNMDDDSQQSNGSGKSAMLEAIAIGLTGETLRKAKTDEIINDAENEARIMLDFANTEDGRKFIVDRTLSRKSPQKIVVSMTENSKTNVIAQSSVADYNKYILETIGLTRDDVFANFILTEDKFISFLSASDRDKKEIINRFSNGIMVDESIAALQEDMRPVEEALQAAEMKVAVCTGRVDAVVEQINTAITEQTERSQKKADRIAMWKQSIADKRAFIREREQYLHASDLLLDKCEALDKLREELEDSGKDVVACYNILQEELDRFDEELSTDYAKKAETNKAKLAEAQKEAKELEKQAKKLDAKLETARMAQEKLAAKYAKFQSDFDVKSGKVDAQIKKLLTSIKNLETENSKLKQQRNYLETDIASLQKQLAGVIVCPNCQHEFTLAGDINIQEARLMVQDREGEVKDILQTIEQNQQSIEDYTQQGREARKKQNELESDKADWSKKLSEASTAVDTANMELSSMKMRQQRLNDSIANLSAAIQNARNQMFDEVYDLLGNHIAVIEVNYKKAQLDITNANGAIQSYEESIKDIEKSSETDVVETLQVSKKKYEQELDAAITKKENVEQELNTLKTQEATFVEFKTHLANTKIDALSHITNEFLEAIGSNIRIAFSGFTVLKSGKVRDKISISLIRDGVDCGSFGKFSKGERARVNLANILAMHKLTNVNCEGDKGLDLLVLDEILDGTDEQGLTNIFDALNQLQITALVVTHTNIAENYPYKTVVNKLNGVSYV